MVSQELSMMRLAEQVYEEHALSEEAVMALVEHITQSEDLVNIVLRQAAYDLLRHAQRTARSKIESHPDSVKKYSAAFQESTQIVCGGFLNWPMMNGTRLKDATKEQVLKDADRYKANAAGNLLKAKFLTLVASRLRQSQKVGDVYSDESLAKLMRKAEAHD